MTAASQQLFEKATRLHQQQNLAEAEACYRELLRQSPQHADCLHQLGALLVQKHGPKQHQEASRLVQSAIQLSPSNARYRHSLGVVYEAAQQWSKAADAFEQAVEKLPTDVQARMQLARALKSLGQLSRAAEAYRAVLQLQPHHPAAHYKLGSVLRRLGQHDAAAEAYRQHLQKSPGHLQATFWLAALDPELQLAACPSEIVAEMFDKYSDHFDQHLVENLGYKTPNMLMDCILRHAPASNSQACPSPDLTHQQQQQQQPRWCRCVDLGCGTGLMGPLLRPHTQWLSGVDLSQGMVNKARERGCYDELAVGELVTHLDGAAAAVNQQGVQPFDLLVAADVFVYLGDLAPVLKAAAAVATERALFAFSTELLKAGPQQPDAHKLQSREGQQAANLQSRDSGAQVEHADAKSGAGADAAPYLLQTTGRYAHSLGYLREVADCCGWQVLCLQEAQIRQNAGQPIWGNLCVLQRQQRPTV